MLWFASDTHFGHVNIIKYCNRPYTDPDHMNRILVDNWNSIVDPDDTVIHLGDVAMGKIAETLPIVSQLNGKKKLRPGNHDRMFAQHGEKYKNWCDKYRAIGFDIWDNGPLWLDLDSEELFYQSEGVNPTWKNAVQLDHFPFHGESDGGREDRYSEFRPADMGQILVHGHVHDMWRLNGRMINVGIDVWGQHPVSLNTVKAVIETL